MKAVVAGVAVLMAIAPVCFSQTNPPAAAPAAAAAATQSSSPSQAGEVAAIVQAGEETTLSSQMAGRILRIHFGLGELAKPGARLLEFECSEGKAQLLAAEAEYRGARETHLTRLRLQSLGAAGELEVTIAAAAADKARSQLELRQAQLAYCIVQAPFPGKVARLRVKAGESVQVGQALIDLVNPGSLKIQMFVPAAWSAWLRPNARFELKIKETGRSYAAHVTKLNARIEGVSQQLEIEARLDGASTGLLPGMVGMAAFPSPSAR